RCAPRPGVGRGGRAPGCRDRPRRRQRDAGASRRGRAAPSAPRMRRRRAAWRSLRKAPAPRRAARQGNERSAAEPLPLLRRALLDVGRSLREVVVELVEGEARFLLLPDTAEGHAQLQEIVGALAALRLLAIALGEA